MLLAAEAIAATPEEIIRPIQDQWAEIKYRMPDKEQADQYRTLAGKSRRIAENHPGMAEPLIWEGIVLSSEAGVRSALSALSLAKEAGQRFEEALNINDQALKGSAYTSMATLYAKVPGWPIGFGDKARAEELFKIFGEYLAESGRVSEARRYLEIALKAPPRPGRDLADSGRRQEVRALLAKLDKEAT